MDDKQLALDDEIRKVRTVRQMQLDGLRLADAFLAVADLTVYGDVKSKRTDIGFALQSKPDDDLAGLVLAVLNFLENFGPIIASPKQYQRSSAYTEACNELNAAHLAYHGKHNLALWLLGLVDDLEDSDNG